jgi:hypothetical protein
MMLLLYRMCIIICCGWRMGRHLRSDRIGSDFIGSESGRNVPRRFPGPIRACLRLEFSNVDIGS